MTAKWRWLPPQPEAPEMVFSDFDVNGHWFGWTVESLGEGRYRAECGTDDPEDDVAELANEGSWKEVMTSIWPESDVSADAVWYLMQCGDIENLRMLDAFPPEDEMEASIFFRTRAGRQFRRMHGYRRKRGETVEEARALAEEKRRRMRIDRKAVASIQAEIRAIEDRELAKWLLAEWRKSPEEQMAEFLSALSEALKRTETEQGDVPEMMPAIWRRRSAFSPLKKAQERYLAQWGWPMPEWISSFKRRSQIRAVEVSICHRLPLPMECPAALKDAGTPPGSVGIQV